jgi:hypothetical protein
VYVRGELYALLLFTSKGKAIDIIWTAGYEEPRFPLGTVMEKHLHDA